MFGPSRLFRFPSLNHQLSTINSLSAPPATRHIPSSMLNLRDLCFLRSLLLNPFPLRFPPPRSPGGTTENSPPIHRWVVVQKHFKSRRDGRTLTHRHFNPLFAVQRFLSPAFNASTSQLINSLTIQRTPHPDPRLLHHMRLEQFGKLRQGFRGACGAKGPQGRAERERASQ